MSALPEAFEDSALHVGPRLTPSRTLLADTTNVDDYGGTVPRRYARFQEPTREQFKGSALLVRQALYLSMSLLSIIITWLTLAVILIGIGVWAAFYYNKTRSDLPLQLLSFGIVFPISFGISFNYSRREAMLREFATIKALALLIFYGARDFPPDTPQHRVTVRAVKQKLGVFLVLFKQTMLHQERSTQVWLAIEEVQRALMDMVAVAPAPFRVSATYGRIQQVFQQMMDAVQRAVAVHDYRSPSALRAFALGFLFVLPAIFAPIFAKYSLDTSLWAGLYCSIITSIMFVALYRVLVNDEDPCDGIGPDDLSLEALSMHVNMMQPNA